MATKAKTRQEQQGVHPFLLIVSGAVPFFGVLAIGTANGNVLLAAIGGVPVLVFTAWISFEAAQAFRQEIAPVIKQDIKAVFRR